MLFRSNPMFNLNNSNDDYIKLKKTDLFLEIGVGCDLYLPFFKLRPELKFDSIDALVEQMTKDVQEARTILSALED